MRATSVAAVTLAALLTPLAGCAQNGGATPDTGRTAPTAPAVRVVLTKSGGIAGVEETVTVQPDGHWTRVDRSGASRTGQLSDADLDRLRRLAADARLPAEATTTPAPMCADAFTYRLTVGDTTTGYEDCPPQATPPPATGAMVELLNRATG